MEAEQKLSAFYEVECIQYFILLFKKVKGLGHTMLSVFFNVESDIVWNKSLQVPSCTLRPFQLQSIF